MTTPKPKARLSEKLVQLWSEQLLDGHAPAELKYLTEDRGFTRETLKECQIGWDDDRVTVPIRDASGALVDCKRYKRNPHTGEPKMVHLTGWGSPARLAFLDQLPDEPGKGRKACVLVCGGEWDALAAIQAGFVAVAPTSGEGALPRKEDLEALAEWPVALCLDDDEAGRKAARKWVPALLAVTDRVKDVRLGVKDVNDWFCDGHTRKQLLSLIADTPRQAQAGARRDSDELRRLAVGQVDNGDSRNGAGLWLACQLRDEQYTEEEAWPLLQEYQAEVTGRKADPYTQDEARNSLQQAFSKPPRSAVGRGAWTFMMTDYGNAERLVARHGDDMRYLTAAEKWLTWDGRRWREDEDGLAMRWAKETVRAMQQEARDLGGDEGAILAKHAARSEAKSKLDSMLKLAQTEPGIAATPAAFDADPWLLNCQNGTVDLRTGTLRPHSRDDLCRRMAPVDYHPDAHAPRFERFLERVVPDRDVREFLQRAVGYSITGMTSEQKLLLLHGVGANGKTTLVELIHDLLGDYGQHMAADTLLAKAGKAIPTDLARLDGKRFVTASEFEDTARPDEALIKRITGGDTITARFLFKGEFEFRAQCTLWVSTNHRPAVRGTDDGIWRRFVLVPFDVQIPEDERDPHLPGTLRGELAGVLAWAVRGCLAWQEQGLAVPEGLRAATEAYRRDSDVLGRFLDDRCQESPDAEVPKGELYADYREWCREVGLQPASSIAFGRWIVQRGYDDARVGKAKTHVWRGLRLVPDLSSTGATRLRVVGSS